MPNARIVFRIHPTRRMFERGAAPRTFARCSTLVVKAVPARICDNCREEYVDEGVAEKRLALAADVARTGVQVDIREFAA